MKKTILFLIFLATIGITVGTVRAISLEPFIDKFSGPLYAKALIKSIVVEMNRTRQWDTDFKAAVAASVSLADLKTRVAALSARPQITASNVYAEITGYIEEYEVAP
jgi:hypothetical protein